MSGDAQVQLQTAIYTALAAALTPTPVYDHVPQGSAFPYVAFGDSAVDEADTDTEIGQDHRIELHTFDRGRGRKRVLEIQKQIRDALDNQGLALGAGAALVYLYYDFSAALLDADGITWHGISRFRAMTTEA